MIERLRSCYRLPRPAAWGLQLIVAIVVPGGLVALALLWWLQRRRAGTIEEV